MESKTVRFKFQTMNQSSLAQTQNTVNIVSLTRSSLLALSLQFIGVTLTYLVQVFLARWMGKIEYGIYEYAVTWSLLLAIPTGLGFPRAVVRFISEYRVKKEWGLMRGLILSSWKLTLVVGLLICLGGTGIISLWNSYHSFSYSSIFLVGIWLVPLQALLLLQEDLGRGADNITLAYGPTKVIWPILLIAGGFILFQQQDSLDSIPMTRVAIATLLTVILFQVWLLWHKFDKVTADNEPIYARREWLEVALPLLLYRTFRELLTQTDILMLGSFIGAEAVGIYSPAVKTSLWAQFILQSINIVVAPTFAILYVQNNRQELQKLISTVTVWIFWSSTTIGLCLIIFAQPVLSLFGAEFMQAHWELRILIMGQLVNALCGSVGNLLSMTGYQNQLMIVSASTALINLVLNAIAIPLWGTVGAAMTTAFTLTVWNIWLSVLVIKNLKVNPSIFNFFLATR